MLQKLIAFFIHINPKTKRALQKTGHRVIGWNLRTYDAILNDETKILNRVKRKLKPGDVILLHDNKPARTHYS